MEGAERKLIILVVEDHADTRDNLAMRLRARGHHVVEAATAGQVRAVLSTLSVDVVLLDLGLPDGDGHDLADELRRQPSFGGTELIAITGFTDPTRRARSIEAGFAAHLQKPYTMEELWSALSRVGPMVRAQ